MRLNCIATPLFKVSLKDCREKITSLPIAINANWLVVSNNLFSTTCVFLHFILILDTIQAVINKSRCCYRSLYKRWRQKENSTDYFDQL